MIYATQSTNPATPSVTFSNTATLTGFSAENNGGSFYINVPNMDWYMNTAVTCT